MFLNEEEKEFLGVSWFLWAKAILKEGRRKLYGRRGRL